MVKLVLTVFLYRFIDQNTIHEIQFCPLFDHGSSSSVYWSCNSVCGSEIPSMAAFENEAGKNRSILK